MAEPGAGGGVEVGSGDRDAVLRVGADLHVVGDGLGQEVLGRGGIPPRAVKSGWVAECPLPGGVLVLGSGWREGGCGGGDGGGVG